ncbi:FeoB-associated Cys-rich membrane protein [Saccharibacillus sacchari]|uniref:FeoB-associated Cys-rich membrane protein n=1 Tax=Saccharibacillus sacchari TaxID=456493 RepID=UPI0004AD8901|nr:FeoB-associated Cys-rich membrane protein [Saccharibacillus sacchari]
MVDWIIAILVIAYSGYVLIRFWKKSKKGACAGCSVQSDGRTPSGCPGCSSLLSEEARQAAHNRHSE